MLRALNQLLSIMIFISLATGCATVHPCGSNQSDTPPLRPAGRILNPDVTYPIDAYDPLEGVNRRIYYFNALFDRYIFLPIVQGYEFITPEFIRTGVSNFFSNVHEIRTLTNSVLQIKGKKAAKTTTRILINTTIGIGGFFDPAASWGIFQENEDFGQTLAFYRVCPGPYLVLPILGPSGLRDAGGLLVDFAVYNAALSALIHEMKLRDREEQTLKTALSLLDAVDTRHRLAFRYYQTGSPFEYELVRLLYIKKRELDIDR